MYRSGQFDTQAREEIRVLLTMYRIRYFLRDIPAVHTVKKYNLFRRSKAVDGHGEQHELERGPMVPRWPITLLSMAPWTCSSTTPPWLFGDVDPVRDTQRAPLAPGWPGKTTVRYRTSFERDQVSGCGAALVDCEPPLASSASRADGPLRTTRTVSVIDIIQSLRFCLPIHCSVFL